MPEVSVVLPCLNEEKTIGICIEKAKKVFEEQGIDGEIIVVDNGSSDKSVEIAESLGAEVVHEEKKGAGNAYIKGFSLASGKYIVIADSDDTYDLLEMPKLLKPLINDEADFVVTSRLKGKILKGAMPWLHQHIGNPLETWIFNSMFKCHISDEHSGFRAFTREALDSLDLKSGGFEYTIEMLVKAVKRNLRIKEVPITYYPRRDGAESKLSSFKHGWVHLRFMLLYSPTYLFLIPGVFLFLFGLIFTTSLLLQEYGVISVSGLELHPMILMSFISILGLQIIAFGLFAKTYAVRIGLDDPDRIENFVLTHLTIEKGSIIGILMLVLGIIIGLYIVLIWVERGSLFVEKLALFAMTLIVIGIQIIFSAFFLSILGVEKR